MQGIWQIDYGNATDFPHPAGSQPLFIPVMLSAPWAGNEGSLNFDINYVPTPGLLNALYNGTAGTSQIIESGLASDPKARARPAPFTLSLFKLLAALSLARSSFLSHTSSPPTSRAPLSSCGATRAPSPSASSTSPCGPPRPRRPPSP